MENNFPCTCGHSISSHPKVGRYANSGDDYIVCNDCFYQNRSIEGVKQLHSEDCLEFQPDNLKYLEEQYVNNIKQ